jgi:hypothetical protein
MRTIITTAGRRSSDKVFSFATAGSDLAPVRPVPHVVADLDGDGITEVVAGRGHEVWAWEWTGSELTVKSGWPADTTTGGNPPEIRGMASGDLDRDGTLEIVVTTTQTVPTSEGGSQVFVVSADGSLFQPAGGHSPAWPRYNNLPGPGNDADRNGPGHSGFGCYGLNAGVGNIDDDPELEVVATYDNHHIQAFDHGLDVFTIPGSADNCVMWPTARGGPIRSGQAGLRWREWIFVDGFESGDTADWSLTVP